jgi:hypothetical protein
MAHAAPPQTVRPALQQPARVAQHDGEVCVRMRGCTVAS